MAGIGTASFLADVGHELPTALVPNLLTATLGAPVAALGLKDRRHGHEAYLAPQKERNTA